MNFLNSYMQGYSTAADGAVGMGNMVSQNGKLLGYNVENGSMMNALNNNAMVKMLRGGPVATHSELQTPQAPVGIYSAFAQHQGAVTLHLREQSNSLHTENFAIVDTATNAVVFRVRGESLASLKSLTEKKNLYDRNGNHLFTIRRKGFSFLKGMFEGIEPRSGRVIFTVESNVGRASTMLISFLNTANKGEHLTLHLGQDMVRVRGRMQQAVCSLTAHLSLQFHHAAKITLGNGVPVAQVARDQASYGQMLCE